MKAKLDPRHKARRIALKKLFWQFETAKESAIREAAGIKQLAFPDYVNYEQKLTDVLVKGVSDNTAALDEILRVASPEWSPEMMSLVDLQILRMAAYEGFVAKITPPKVAVNEAVELAKRYGGQDSSRFVNGVLGAVMKTYHES
jgi:N utilization substance protein B